MTGKSVKKLVQAILKVLLVIGGLQAVLTFFLSITNIFVLAVVWLPLFALPFGLLYYFSMSPAARKHINISASRYIWVLALVFYVISYGALRYSHLYVHYTSIDICSIERVKYTKHRVRISSVWDATGLHEILTSPFIISVAYFPLSTMEEWAWIAYERKYA